MRRSRRIIFGASVLCLLIIVFFLSPLLFNRDTGSGGGSNGRILIRDIGAGDFKKIILTNGKGVLVFKRNGKGLEAEVPPGIGVDNEKVYQIGLAALKVNAEVKIKPEEGGYGKYGLENPSGKVEVVLNSGEIKRLFIGSKTSGANGIYVKLDGSDYVYILGRKYLNTFLSTLDDLRLRNLPEININKITYLKIAGSRKIEILPVEPGELINGGYSVMKMIGPYRPRGIDAKKLSEYLKSIPNPLVIKDFIDDNPETLSQFGLGTDAVEFILADSKSSLHIYVGDDDKKGGRYIRQAGSPQVFTIDSSDLKFLDIEPFNITEKLIFLMNIEYVDAMGFIESGKRYNFGIKRSKDSTEYYFNSKQMDEKKFKELYKSVIGLIADGESSGFEKPDYRGAELEIHFRLNKGKDRNIRIKFVNAGGDFYLVYINGISEFVVSDTQISKIKNILSTF